MSFKKVLFYWVSFYQVLAVATCWVVRLAVKGAGSQDQPLFWKEDPPRDLSVDRTEGRGDQIRCKYPDSSVACSIYQIVSQVFMAIS